MTNIEEANAIVGACLRNNSSLEGLHAAGAIDDDQMKTLMLEVCSNLEVVLRWRNELAPKTFGGLILAMGMNSSSGWDTESKSGGLAMFAEVDVAAIVASVKA